MPNRLLSVALILTSSAAFADDTPLDLDRFTLAGQGGLFGTRPTVGARIAAHTDLGSYTFEEVGVIHGGPYGIRFDEDSEFGKLFMIGSVGCEPYVGLDFDLSSVWGAAAWLRPGITLHIPIGSGRLVLNAAGLVTLLSQASSGAQVEALLYFDKKGLFLVAEAQLLSKDSFEVAGIGWAFY